MLICSRYDCGRFGMDEVDRAPGDGTDQPQQAGTAIFSSFVITGW